MRLSPTQWLHHLHRFLPLMPTLRHPPQQHLHLQLQLLTLQHTEVKAQKMHHSRLPQGPHSPHPALPMLLHPQQRSEPEGCWLEPRRQAANSLNQAGSLCAAHAAHRLWLRAPYLPRRLQHAVRMPCNPSCSLHASSRHKNLSECWDHLIILMMRQRWRQ